MNPMEDRDSGTALIARLGIGTSLVFVFAGFPFVYGTSFGRLSLHGVIRFNEQQLVC